MIRKFIEWVRGDAQKMPLRNRALLNIQCLECRTMPAIINVGSISPGIGAIYDDGLANSVTQLASGEYFASDLGDAIAFANGLPPQGGNGSGPADPVGPHQIKVNVENVYLTRRLPTIVVQLQLVGNSAVSSVLTPEDLYPNPIFAPTSVTVKASVRRGDALFQDAQGNAVDNFRILDATTSWLELKGLRLAGGKETETSGIDQSAHGGLLRFNGTDSPLVVDNCFFVGGRTTGNGGAIYSATRGITITDSWFSENFAFSGAAVWMNTASIQSLSVTGTRFSTNASLDNGGAVWAATLGTISFVRSGFLTNYTIPGLGGSVYVSGANTVSFDRTFIDDSDAVNGSAIYILSTSNLYFSQSKVTANTPIYAIYAYVHGVYSVFSSELNGEEMIIQ